MNPNELGQASLPTEQPSVSTVEPPKKRETLPNLSLIYGLLSFGSSVFGFWSFCLTFVFALYMGLAAVVLGFISLIRKTASPKRAIIGLIAGALGLALLFLSFYISTAYPQAVHDFFNSLGLSSWDDPVRTNIYPSFFPLG